MVGTSGRYGSRFSLVTASTRSFPARTCGMPDGTRLKCTLMWPPSSALNTSALPLYGTCTRRTPAMVLNISAARCVDVPGPDDA